MGNRTDDAENTRVAHVHPVREASGAPVLPPARLDEPFTLIIFGATGDLTHRKLVPALYAMEREGLLPERYALVGFARRDYSDDTFRDLLRGSIREHSRVPVEENALETLCGRLHYHRGDLTEAEAYASLRDRLRDEATFPPCHVHYLAIAPELFDDVVTRLKGHGLIRPARETPWSRIVIEKPFGHNLASARDLNRDLLQQAEESQLYRIDHYLGKETVQNILSFRFANAIFEPVFNHHYVEQVQITAAETVGMESGRGAYYDQAGAVRDMMQNHLLQLLCLMGMEPPSGLSPESIHNEKVDLLRCVAPLTPEDVRERAVRAQYRAGVRDGRKTSAYVEEDRVAADSVTPTYAALRLGIENWRWAGVPFYLRTGKRLRKRVSEIAVRFKMPPLQLFRTVACEGDVCDLTRAQPNILVFRIQPDEGISLRFAAKRPALQLVVESVAMDFSYAETWNKSLPEAYERLLMDVVRGDTTLFTRSDEVEAAWGLIDPVIEAWAGDDAPLHYYDPGSWGPEEANRLMAEGEPGWREPD